MIFFSVELQFTLIMQGVTSGLAPSASDENIDSMDQQQQQQQQIEGEDSSNSRQQQEQQQQQQQQQLVAVKISEELETTIKQLRAELHEAKSRNLYLTERVEEQQRYCVHTIRFRKYRFKLHLGTLCQFFIQENHQFGRKHCAG